MQKIKKGDKVWVITGQSKKQTGNVLKVIKDYILVEGINMVTKHVKPNPQLNIEGGIKKKEKPIHISNVRIYNPITQKPDGVKIKILSDGKKIRIFKSTQEKVDFEHE